jgi:hypothetical protein
MFGDNLYKMYACIELITEIQMKNANYSSIFGSATICVGKS